MEHAGAQSESRADTSNGIQRALDRYWKRNVRIMCLLLGIWFLAGLGCGVLWADRLNEYFLPGSGFPLGFWFAQQGSILVFVLLILTYCLWMNRLDRLHREELREIREERAVTEL